MLSFGFQRVTCIFQGLPPLYIVHAEYESIPALVA